MINFFVETKSEYTTQLVNVLTPLIFEGLKSIYTESLKVSNETDNVLKVFQSFLRRIPKWNTEMIKQETDRIMNNTKSFSWLGDLVKATVKANIVVLTYNPSINNNTHKIDPKYYQDIKLEDYIHKVYIECARELWNNPYLMYHQYQAIELKRNQRDTVILIKDSIREAIRKLLPVKQILEIYLGEKLEPVLPNDEFDKNITEADEKNIQKLINKDLNNVNQIGGNESKDLDLKPENKDLNSKILEILNKDPSESISKDNTYVSPKPDHNNTDTPMTKATKNISDSNTSPENSENYKSKNIDDKIKNILEKDLGETDIDTSLSYRPETNENKYQEIFSNNQNGGPASPVGNNTNKDSSKSKRKFFNNYLNF
jgi:hypothetical protein